LGTFTTPRPSLARARNQRFLEEETIRMNNRLLNPIGAAERELFQRDGAVCIRGLLDADWIAFLRAAIDEAMAKPSDKVRDLAQESKRKGSFYTDIFMWKNYEKFGNFVAQSPIGEAAAQLMGSQQIRLYNDHLLVKEPGTDAPTHWHQDLPYFRIQGRQACSVWIGLDPVRRETGAMSFV